MQMMYEMIYKALEEVGLHKIYEPQDYLNFFCLGNREVLDVRDGVEAGNGEKNPQVLSSYPPKRSFTLQLSSLCLLM